MERPPGRREAHKLATRTALREAASRLFAEHGYEATTAAEIARAAHVAERTLYRYFDGKEELLAEELLAHIDVLHDAIRRRPAEEPPLLAVWRAMTEVGGQLSADGFWLAGDPPLALSLLRRSTPRPLRRLEESIATAVLVRLSAEPDVAPRGRAARARAELQSQVVAAVAVALLRTAILRHGQLKRHAGTGSPGVGRLLDDAFAALTDVVVADQPVDS
jgi:AcrR family transcriptional regulator